MASNITIQRLNEQRAAIVRELLDLFPLIPGAFKEVFRKCGKPNCWCAQNTRGHSLRRITWTEGGHAQSKAVAENDIDWYIIATDNYRRFQQLKKLLRETEASLHESLDEYSKSQVKISRNDRDELKRIAKT